MFRTNVDKRLQMRWEFKTFIRNRIATARPISEYFRQNVCDAKRARRTLSSTTEYIYTREMDGCLVDCIAYSARAVQVFHGNDCEHWQTGKCFHTRARTVPPPLPPPLFPCISSITPWYSLTGIFHLFFYFLIKRTINLNVYTSNAHFGNNSAGPRRRGQ